MERLEANLKILNSMMYIARDNPDLRIGQILQIFGFTVTSEDFYKEGSKFLQEYLDGK